MQAEKWSHAFDCEAGDDTWVERRPCDCGLSDILAALEHGPVVLDGEGIRGTLVEAIGEDRALRTLGGQATYRIVPLEEPHA